jgi:hypothetical protein
LPLRHAIRSWKTASWSQRRRPGRCALPGGHRPVRLDHGRPVPPAGLQRPVLGLAVHRVFRLHPGHHLPQGQGVPVPQPGRAVLRELSGARPGVRPLPALERTARGHLGPELHRRHRSAQAAPDLRDRRRPAARGRRRPPRDLAEHPQQPGGRADGCLQRQNGLPAGDAGHHAGLGHQGHPPG